MKRNILIILAFLLPLLSARAQYVTYNHDETKMYQVTVMETGVGELTPRAFYGVVNNRYYQDAAETNKLRYRSEAAAHGTVQVGISETIDTSLTKRAEVEALNMADRQVDLAWQAEGPKIQSRLEAFNRNIARLTEVGGNAGDLTLWQERCRPQLLHAECRSEEGVPGHLPGHHGGKQHAHRVHRHRGRPRENEGPPRSHARAAEPQRGDRRRGPWPVEGDV